VGGDVAGEVTLGDLCVHVARVDLRASAIPTELLLRTGRECGLDVEYVLTVQTWAPHRDTGVEGWSRHIFAVPDDISPSAVVAFTVDCVQAAWRHEMDEALHVDGRRLRDPHAGEEGDRPLLSRSA
jgi:hypothetical protein